MLRKSIELAIGAVAVGVSYRYIRQTHIKKYQKELQIQQILDQIEKNKKSTDKNDQ